MRIIVHSADGGGETTVDVETIPPGWSLGCAPLPLPVPRGWIAVVAGGALQAKAPLGEARAVRQADATGNLEDILYHRHPEDWQRYHTRYITPQGFHGRCGCRERR